MILPDRLLKFRVIHSDRFEFFAEWHDGHEIRRESFGPRSRSQLRAFLTDIVDQIEAAPQAMSEQDALIYYVDRFGIVGAVQP